MGECKWAGYGPDDINWDARARIDELIKDRVTGPVNVPRLPKSHALGGAIFCAAMALGAIITWMMFL